ncbi:MAG: hypothetical protein FWG70_11925 [Oscillospiraceae bacterium]|nr:hypothetical protein [Oscillospiraceae bacterium]
MVNYHAQRVQTFLKNVDDLDLIKKIKDFRKLDFRNISDSDLDKAIIKVLLYNNKFVIMTNNATYPAGTKFFRVRKLKGSIIPDENLRVLSDFWNPPADKTPLGRLNKIGESLLYTAPINPMVAIKEMNLEPNIFYAIIVYVARSDIKVNIIGGDFDYEANGISDRKAIFIHEIYNNFLRDEFSRDVGEGTEFLYKISEKIAKDYFDLPPRDVQDAWAYPSVQDKSMYNVCFKPDIAKELLELQGAIIAKNIKPDEITPVAVSRGFDNNGSSQFYPIGSDIQIQYFPEIQSLKENQGAT